MHQIVEVPPARHLYQLQATPVGSADGPLGRKLTQGGKRQGFGPHLLSLVPIQAGLEFLSIDVISFFYNDHQHEQLPRCLRASTEI